jgi:hypothetical protein
VGGVCVASRKPAPPRHAGHQKGPARPPPQLDPKLTCHPKRRNTVLFEVPSTYRPVQICGTGSYLPVFEAPRCDPIIAVLAKQGGASEEPCAGGGQIKVPSAGACAGARAPPSRAAATPRHTDHDQQSQFLPRPKCRAADIATGSSKLIIDCDVRCQGFGWWSPSDAGNSAEGEARNA